MKKIARILVLVILLFTMMNGLVEIYALDKQKEEFEAGKMYLNDLEFPERTVLFSNSGYVCFSLDCFFEGIGGNITYDRMMENIRINYLEDALLWEKGYVEGVPNIFRIRREVNGSNINTGFHKGYFLLDQITPYGGYIMIDERIYLRSKTFEKMIEHLGYWIDIDYDAKNVKTYARTVNKYIPDSCYEYVDIEGEAYSVGALTNALWVVFETISLDAFEIEKENNRDMFADEEPQKLMLIDEEGRIYKKTDYVMKAPTTNVSSNKLTPIMHNVGSKDEDWQEGTAYFYNLKFPEGTVLYDTPKGTLIYLRSFFEGIGSEVIYDEETKDVKINHINQVLLWEKSEEENTFTIRRSVNPSNVKIDSADGYFKLGDEEVEGWYTRIDGRTYMDLESFKRMVSYLGYQADDNPEAKELRISPVTLLNWDTVSNQPTFENVIDGKRYYLSPLSDGSWIGRMKNNSRSVAYVDGEGQVYELTNQAVDGSLADKNRS